jgi:uncharacterized protein (DUF302 family)
MMAVEGLVSVLSRFGAKETIDRLEAALLANGAAIFARVDHAAGAAQAGQSLRPTELLIFGNPQVGTPLMQSQQSIGIDLPLKALAWEDEAGAAHIAYNDPKWLATRHGIGREGDETVAKMTAMLGALARKASGAA